MPLLHILEWPFIVASLRHTCVIIMLSNQHLDMPHLWGGWIISEKCSLTQILTDLWTIFERNRYFVYIEKVLDIWVQLMKNGGKNKSVIILFSVWMSHKDKLSLFNFGLFSKCILCVDLIILPKYYFKLRKSVKIYIKHTFFTLKKNLNKLI